MSPYELDLLAEQWQQLPFIKKTTKPKQNLLVAAASAKEVKLLSPRP